MRNINKTKKSNKIDELYCNGILQILADYFTHGCVKILGYLYAWQWLSLILH